MNYYIPATRLLGTFSLSVWLEPNIFNFDHDLVKDKVSISECSHLQLEAFIYDIYTLNFNNKK